MKFCASFHIYQLVIDDNASGGRHNFLHNQPVGKKLTYSLFTIKILDLKEPCKNNWKEKSGILRKASLSKVVELSNLGYNFTIYLQLHNCYSLSMHASPSNSILFSYSIAFGYFFFFLEKPRRDYNYKHEIMYNSNDLALMTAKCLSDCLLYCLSYFTNLPAIEKWI